MCNWIYILFYKLICEVKLNVWFYFFKYIKKTKAINMNLYLSFLGL